MIKLPEKRPPNALTFPARYLFELITLSRSGFAEFWWFDPATMQRPSVDVEALRMSLRPLAGLLMPPEAFCLRGRFLLTRPRLLGGSWILRWKVINLLPRNDVAHQRVVRQVLVPLCVDLTDDANGWLAAQIDFDESRL